MDRSDESSPVSESPTDQRFLLVGSAAQIDDNQIMTMSVKELNTLLKSMNPSDAASIKRRRRILKNKGYAASSRNRQTSLVGNLSVERNQLMRQVNPRETANCIFPFVMLT